MTKLQSSPLELSSTPSGFSIVSANGLTLIASKLVLLHINKKLNQEFDTLECAIKYIIINDFISFKDKPARTLPIELARRFVDYLENSGFLNSEAGDFVTDEEGLGYENIYWRLVRRGSSYDVGPVHADRWFWDLGEASFPSSHTRIKVWMPLLQDNQNPSLMILPGSQNTQYEYDFKIDQSGKRKPIFTNEAVESAMVEAPIRVGSAIIFHDSLLHKGRATSSDRVSIEFTLAHALKNSA